MSLPARCAEGCQVLIERGGSLPDVEDRFQRSTPLHMAARKGATACVSMLVAIGADIMKRNIDGDTPLHIAARCAAHAGGCVCRVGVGCVTCSCVVLLRGGFMSTCKVLLEHGAQVNDRTPRGQWTPLMHAAKAGHTSVAKVLIDNGADVNDTLPVTLHHTVGREVDGCVTDGGWFAMAEQLDSAALGGETQVHSVDGSAAAAWGSPTFHQQRTL